MLLTIFISEIFHCLSSVDVWFWSCLYCPVHSREKCCVHIALHLKGYLSHSTPKSLVPAHPDASVAQHTTCSLLFSSLGDTLLPQ